MFFHWVYRKAGSADTKLEPNLCNGTCTLFSVGGGPVRLNVSSPRSDLLCRDSHNKILRDLAVLGYLGQLHPPVPKPLYPLQSLTPYQVTRACGWDHLYFVYLANISVASCVPSAPLTTITAHLIIRTSQWCRSSNCPHLADGRPSNPVAVTAGIRPRQSASRVLLLTVVLCGARLGPRWSRRFC